MRTLRFLLYKEFRQIFRNTALLPLIFAMPIIQLIILAYAADFEVKNLQLYVVDQDQSSLSHRLSGKFTASNYFVMMGQGVVPVHAEKAMERGDAEIIIRIPAGWEQDLMRGEPAQVRIIANAIDGTKGALGSAYSARVIQDFNQQLLQEYGSKLGAVSAMTTSGALEVEFRHWYNPNMDYKTFMVPGVLVLLVTMIGMFLSAMNIVREKELGTIEQLNVTPIKKYQFVLGKLLPFLALALFDFALGLLVARLLYNIPFEGSILLLFSFSILYLVLVLGLGLLISTISQTQQQAMFIAWFILVIFIFLSGLFTAIENMPSWAQKLTYLNPVRYFIEVIRLVMLKGATWADIQTQALIVGGYAAVVNLLAIWNYRKTG